MQPKIELPPIPFYLSKMLVEKGFPENGTSLRQDYYNWKGELNGDCTDLIKAICNKKWSDKKKFKTYPAPSIEFVKRWFKVIHHISIDVWPIFGTIHYQWSVMPASGKNPFKPFMNMSFKDDSVNQYDEASVEAIRFALTYIKETTN